MSIKNIIARGIGFSPGSIVYVVTGGLSLRWPSATFGNVMVLDVKACVPCGVAISAGIPSAVKVEATLPSGIKIVAIG